MPSDRKPRWNDIKRKFPQFIVSFGRHWISLVAGILSVILSALGLQGSRWFWIGAGLCFLLASFWVWLSDSLDLDYLTEPKLWILFEQGMGSYLQRTVYQQEPQI